MEKSGPLNQFSNMRFEGKHNFYKKSLNSSCNHKNLLHTLGVKAQIQIANFLLNYDFDVKNYTKKYLDSFHSFNFDFLQLSDKVIESIVVLGKKIVKGCVLETFNKTECTYELVKVISIIERDSKILLVCKILKNVKVCESLDCYRFEGESDDFYFYFLIDICISRLSYVYKSINQMYVNLSIE